ncbi:MAG: PIN domain-containing protein [Planctomycetota bacterium]|nr:PIN domain-containing protein [Planctomycetota bacterium]
MDKVCDTNIWYRLGDGRLQIGQIKAAGDKLLASPVNFMEMASKLTPDTFRERKAAAKAVIDHADEILPDPERHLASLWELEVEEIALDWRDGFKAIAEATEYSDLEIGVSDFNERVVRTLKPGLAAAWRSQHYNDFVDDVEKLIDRYWPGYYAARRAGQIKYMGGEMRTLWESATRNPDVVKIVAFGTFQRAALHCQEIPPWPGAEQYAQVWPHVEPVTRAYCQYIYRVGTTYAPKPNDWGDLECFVYLQQDRKLLTLDQRWLDIAADSGLSSHISPPPSP